MDASDMPSPRLSGRESVLAELLQSHRLDPVVAFVELLLNDAHGVEGGTEGESALLALVTDLSQLPAVPHHVAVQIAFGEKAGRQSADRIARLLARAQRLGMSTDEYVARAAARGELRRDATVRRFAGQVRRRPDDRRIRRGIELLRRMTARIPSGDRPPLLCILAWLHWARGQRPIAMSYLGEAQRIEPQNVLAHGLRHLLATRTPQWLAR